MPLILSFLGRGRRLFLIRGRHLALPLLCLAGNLLDCLLVVILSVVQGLLRLRTPLNLVHYVARYRLYRIRGPQGSVLYLLGVRPEHLHDGLVLLVPELPGVFVTIDLLVHGELLRVLVDFHVGVARLRHHPQARDLSHHVHDVLRDAAVHLDRLFGHELGARDSRCLRSVRPRLTHCLEHVVGGLEARRDEVVELVGCRPSEVAGESLYPKRVGGLSVMVEFMRGARHSILSSPIERRV